MKLTLDQALQKGIEAHRVGKAEEADRYYTAILKANPKHPDANHNMGVLAVGVGKAEAAVPFFKTALEANPKIAQFWLSYINALIELDRKEDAKTVFEQAKSNGAKGDGFDQIELQLNTSSVEVINQTQLDIPTQPNILDEVKLDKALKLANKKVKDGLREEAKQIYQDILKKFPKNKRALEGIKTFASKTVTNTTDIGEPPGDQLQSLINLYTERQYQEVIGKGSELLKQFPNSINLYNIIGAANKELGKLEEAIEAYNKALQLKPDFAEANYNMGNALKDQGKLGEAIKAYTKALSIKPGNAEAYNNMGVALQDQGKLDEAIGAYNKALQLKPDLADGYNNMGKALQEQGKLDDATEAYDKAIKLQPDEAEGYNNIGVIFKEQDKLEEAIKAYRKAIILKPDYAEANYNMGNALKENGQLEEAIKAYSKAITLKPDYAEVYYNMGVTLQEQGKLDEAIEACNKALSIRPDYVAVYNSMGVTLQEQGKLEEAIEAYKKALFIKPEDAETIENALYLSTQFSDRELIKEKFGKKLEIPKFQVIQAIRAFLFYDRKLVREHIKIYNSCTPSSIAELNSNNQIFCSAYSHFLLKLTETPIVSKPTFLDNQSVFHLGESHCLSYAHKKIKIYGVDYTVVPRITFGAKAYHFSRKKDDIFKAITRANFYNLPEGSKIFLSFGEIDCRPNEGFISAAFKLARTIDDIVLDTVEGYVSWFAKQNEIKNHSLFFFNVPAPIYDENQPVEVNQKIKNTIKLFNNLLNKTVLNYNLNIIDVYKFTVGHDEFSNCSFHIDNRHLSSHAIPEIEKQIGTFL